MTKEEKKSVGFFRLALGEVAFVIIASLIITIFENILFYKTVWGLVSFNALRDYLFAFTIPIFIFCVLNILFSIITWPYIGKFLIFVILLISAVINYFMFSYRIVIDSDMITNAFQTDIQESMALLTPSLAVFFVVLGVVPCAVLAWFKIKWRRSIIKQFAFRVLNIVVSVVIILIIAFGFYKDYASLVRNNRYIVKMILPSNFIGATIQHIHQRYEANRPYHQIGLDAHGGNLIKQQKKKTLVVFVVGETARAQNFGLGGYTRNTTPLLSKQNGVVYYPNTSSCGTSTAVSVPCMFSNMPRVDYNWITADHQDNALDLLARSGVNVYWRENDGGCKGVCKNVPSVEVTDWNLSQFCKGGTCHDDILLHKLQDYIDGLKGNGVIILHQIGSHGPTYHQRYPAEYRVYTPTCDTNQIQNCSSQELVNTYDNTILYTDSVLNNVIELLKNNQHDFSTAMLYVSDHGESLGENGLYLHGAPYMFAPSQQTHVPMLLWLSNDYQANYGIDESCMKKMANREKTSQDNIFHTLLGLFDVQTTEYQSQLDLLSQCRVKSE